MLKSLTKKQIGCVSMIVATCFFHMFIFWFIWYLKGCPVELSETALSVSRPYLQNSRIVYIAMMVVTLVVTILLAIQTRMNWKDKSCRWLGKSIIPVAIVLLAFVVMGFVFALNSPCDVKTSAEKDSVLYLNEALIKVCGFIMLAIVIIAFFLSYKTSVIESRLILNRRPSILFSTSIVNENDNTFTKEHLNINTYNIQTGDFQQFNGQAGAQSGQNGRVLNVAGNGAQAGAQQQVNAQGGKALDINIPQQAGTSPWTTNNQTGKVMLINTGNNAQLDSGQVNSQTGNVRQLGVIANNNGQPGASQAGGSGSRFLGVGPLSNAKTEADNNAPSTIRRLGIVGADGRNSPNQSGSSRRSDFNFINNNISRKESNVLPQDEHRKLNIGPGFATKNTNASANNNGSRVLNINSDPSRFSGVSRDKKTRTLNINSDRRGLDGKEDKQLKNTRQQLNINSGHKKNNNFNAKNTQRRSLGGIKFVNDSINSNVWKK